MLLGSAVGPAFAHAVQTSPFHSVGKIADGTCPNRTSVPGDFAHPTNTYNANTNTIVALLPRLRFSGVVASRPMELRVRPVAIAMYCLPSTA